MTAPESSPLPESSQPAKSLPASTNCVLARRDPAGLAADLASARLDMAAFVGLLDDGRTYLYPKRADAAREQGKALARRLRGISVRLCLGRCARLRGHRRLGRFVSVHAREVLNDGGSPASPPESSNSPAP